MPQPFIGQIIMFGGSFAIRGYALCDGQLLPISQNQALFSILGTTYGGDGRVSFGLPELRGRVPLHQGSGPGLPSYNEGSKGGSPTRQLTNNNLPSHNHTVLCTTDDGDGDDPEGNVLAKTDGANIYANVTPGESMKNPTTNSVGNGQQFNIQNAILGINYEIAMQGLFPSRN